MASLSPEAYMREAIALAESGYTAPNPLVGCLVVKEGRVIGAGYHRAAGEPHAEIEALQQAGKEARGADMYVTLEPCSHHGRTPPCADAIVQAKLATVTFATPDPTHARGGARILSDAGITVREGVLAAEAASMNRIWLHSQKLGRPLVTLKAAITLDGFIARTDGTSKWITNEESRVIARRLRAQHGAVLVGRGTVECDDPELTVRDVEMQEPPIRIVLDPQSKLNAGKKIFQDSAAQTWRINGSIDLQGLLDRLHVAGVPGLLVEGGAATYAHFLRQELVDRLDLFIAPKLFGEGIRWASELLPTNLKLVHARTIGEDVWLRYDLTADGS